MMPLVGTLLMPPLAWAQSPTPSTQAAETFCGFPEGSWISESAEASALAGPEFLFKTELKGTGPFTRAFRLETEATLRMEAAATASGDPVLRLYGAGGELLAENDDAVGTYNSQLLETLPAGNYCLQADDLRGAADMTVQIGAETTTPLIASRELACGPETAAEILGGTALEEAIAKGAERASVDANERAYLRFTLKAPASLSLRAEGGAGIDPRITLFDAEGRSIAENDDADGLSARLDFQPELAAGSYCLGIRANEPKAGAITVTAETINVESYMRRAYARGQLVPLSGEYPVKPLRFNPTQGEIVLQGAGVTWFSFELKEPSLVGIRSHGTLSGADTMLRLFNGEGALIIEIDDQDSDRNARIPPQSLSAGRYFLALSDHQASEAVGSPLRPVSLMAERFIRAPAD